MKIKRIFILFNIFEVKNKVEIMFVHIILKISIFEVKRYKKVKINLKSLDYKFWLFYKDFFEKNKLKTTKGKFKNSKY